MKPRLNIWSAVAERSGDTALASRVEIWFVDGLVKAPSPLRSAGALQMIALYRLEPLEQISPTIKPTNAPTPIAIPTDSHGLCLM
jgi:hypothetical protein